MNWVVATLLLQGLVELIRIVADLFGQKLTRKTIAVHLVLVLLLGGAGWTQYRESVSEDAAQQRSTELLEVCAKKGCDPQFLDDYLASEQEVNRLRATMESSAWGDELQRIIPTKRAGDPARDTAQDVALRDARLKFGPFIDAVVAELDSGAARVRSAGVDITSNVWCAPH